MNCVVASLGRICGSDSDDFSTVTVVVAEPPSQLDTFARSV